MPSKGTIIQVFGDRAVIMTDQCEYREIKIKNGQLQPGEEIEYLPGDLIGQRRPVLKAIAMAASFLVFLWLSFSLMQNLLSSEAYAFIGLDINPSLEIAIDRDYRVVGVTAFNDEGKKVIQDQKIKGTGLEEALTVILQNCSQEEYLEREQRNNVALSLFTPDGSGSAELMDQVYGILNVSLNKNKVQASVFYFNINQDTREQAIRNNVSPSRYLLWTEAGKRGLSTTLDEVSLKDPRINKIAHDIEEKHSSFNGVWVNPEESQGEKVPGGAVNGPQGPGRESHGDLQGVTAPRQRGNDSANGIKKDKAAPTVQNTGKPQSGGNQRNEDAGGKK